jgi:hypothetical protein
MLQAPRLARAPAARAFLAAPGAGGADAFAAMSDAARRPRAGLPVPALPLLFGGSAAPREGRERAPRALFGAGRAGREAGGASAEAAQAGGSVRDSPAEESEAAQEAGGSPCGGAAAGGAAAASDDAAEEQGESDGSSEGDEGPASGPQAGEPAGVQALARALLACADRVLAAEQEGFVRKRVRTLLPRLARPAPWPIDPGP